MMDGLPRKKTEAPVTVTGANLPNCIADFDVPFPKEWNDELRRMSLITDKFSHLRPYWYRAGMRWVLYDCVPRMLIKDDEGQGAPIVGKELIELLEGPRPSDLSDDNRSPFVSDVQHEFYRRYRVYARPFWVLQGDAGGHQVKFSPWQQNVLIAKGLPSEPPPIGSLPACPFDNRVTMQLNHLNRLHRLDDRLDKLQASGSVEAANAEMDGIQREIREAEAAFIVNQMTPLVEMSTSLVHGANSRSEHADQVVRVAPGKAAEAYDAWQQYLATGDYTLRDLTGR